VKFFLDHDVPAAVTDALARHGHEVTQVAGVLPGDSADDLVFTTAQQNRCIIVTCNRNDFLALAKKAPHCGLIILIRRRSAQLECTNLLRLIRQAGDQGLDGNINFT
jgi:predicted nuclease of predicted toxin-antitoxin system